MVTRRSSTSCDTTQRQALEALIPLQPHTGQGFARLQSEQSLGLAKPSHAPEWVKQRCMRKVEDYHLLSTPSTKPTCT